MIINHQEKLVKKAIKGNRAAFTKLIKMHEQTLYRVSISILRSDFDSADAVQTTIMNAYENINKLKQPPYFKTWLTRILINECYQMLRNRKQVVPLPATELASSVDNEYGHIEVKEVVDMLPDNLRLVIILFYFEALKVKEIAEILEMPEGTVKTYLHRGRKQLYTFLTKEEVGEDEQKRTL